jgi:putative acyl-CoA dehydrogenase
MHGQHWVYRRQHHLYREAPVSSAWEGSGNDAKYLDVLPCTYQETGVLDALFTELGDGHGDARLIPSPAKG